MFQKYLNSQIFINFLSTRVNLFMWIVCFRNASRSDGSWSATPRDAWPASTRYAHFSPTFTKQLTFCCFFFRSSKAVLIVDHHFFVHNCISLRRPWRSLPSYKKEFTLQHRLFAAVCFDKNKGRISTV